MYILQLNDSKVVDEGDTAMSKLKKIDRILLTSILLLVGLLAFTACGDTADKANSNEYSGNQNINVELLSETAEHIIDSGGNPIHCNIVTNAKNIPKNLEITDTTDFRVEEIDDGPVFFMAQSKNEFEEAFEALTDSQLYYLLCEIGCDYQTLLNTYDDAYFENNILIFYYAEEPCVGYVNWINRIEIIDDTIVVNMNRYDPGWGYMAISYWFSEIKVAKADIPAAKNATLVLNSVKVAPKTLLIYIKEQYISQFEQQLFTIESFGLDNILEIKYGESLTTPCIWITMKESGSEKAAEAAAHLNSLDFVFEVIY